MITSALASSGWPEAVELSEWDVEALAEDIIRCNQHVVSQRGYGVDLSSASEAYRSGIEQNVRSVLFSSFVPLFGHSPCDRFADLFYQVSCFAERLAKNHIFSDGNKRTTVTISLALLGRYGVKLDIPDTNDPEKNEVYLWIQDVVTGDRSRNELADFLRSRAVLIEDS